MDKQSFKMKKSISISEKREIKIYRNKMFRKMIYDSMKEIWKPQGADIRPSVWELGSNNMIRSPVIKKGKFHHLDIKYSI